MSRPGIRQGFVCFGTVAHRILVAMHQAGDMRLRDLDEELRDVAVAAISMQLTRLERYGLVHRIKKAPLYSTGDKTQWIYSLTPPARPPAPYHRATTRERSARERGRRAQRAVRVPSVFDWRGTCQL